MRILLAEDDRVIADGLGRSLRKSGYAVDWVANGADADSALVSGTYDLVILDLGLPRLSGQEVLKRLRARKSNVPVLILTALDGTGDRVKGLDLGADDFIVKPFATAELLSRIRAVVRRSRRQSSDVWNFGDLSIEPHRHLVLVAGRDPQLSLREFQLLVELARDYGQVVPKSTLAQRLNPLGEPLESGAIEVHMSNLRKKIGAERICTVRGVGYMLGK